MKPIWHFLTISRTYSRAHVDMHNCIAYGKRALTLASLKVWDRHENLRKKLSRPSGSVSKYGLDRH